MLSVLIRGPRKVVLLGAGLMIVVIALADWRITTQVPLGFLYLFPMLFMGSVLNGWQIAGAAGICTFLTEAFDSFEWSPEIGIPRDILIFAAFLGTGLLFRELTRNREEIERESKARQAAEEQLRILVENSPVAVFTSNSEGSVLLANDAAHQLFGLAPGALPGRSIFDYLPALVNVQAPERSGQSFRTLMQSRGRRQDGEIFLADIWFSTYRTSAGSRLAAMVMDTSEDLRNREEASLHWVLDASRILVSAVSHEIRNICAAMSVVQQNLTQPGSSIQVKGLETLRTLTRALERIAATNLRKNQSHPTAVDIPGVLEELRIIIEQSLRECDIEVHWDIEPNLPSAWADRHRLLQAFLNLTKNSERAMLNQTRRELTVSAKSGGDRIEIRFTDTGGGIANPDRLFQPFQEGSEATGLGLFLSHALLRSFRGDLRYEPAPYGSAFIIELSTAPPD
jgi:two-component system sensor kinase FixL